MNNNIAYPPFSMKTPLLFLALTMLLMLLVLYFVQQGEIGKPAVLIGLFGPAIIAVLFSYLEGGGRQVKQLLSQYVAYKASWRHYALATLLIPALIYLTMLVTELSGQITYSTWFSGLSIAQLLFIPLISIGEELGWRGYLQPLFRRRYGLLAASLLVGCVWAIWHLTGYYFDTGVVEGLPFELFFMWVVGAALVMGYLYEKTNSVLLAVLFHTSVNLSLNVFKIIPEFSGSIMPFTMLIILVWLVGLGLIFCHSKK
ncbi:CPBP family intramembrane glutamic endopeptidase [Thalassotalea maritima]|uniref:CPBP family intramembrane glutamic endopeptidase n=1 Tax=Thalassotalea maritima TaxID=3242416 RepID=UPI003526EB64